MKPKQFKDGLIVPSVSNKTPLFKLVKKHCNECGKKLFLKNIRDIERKKYCSRTCRSKVTGRNTDMRFLWAKSYTPEANAKKSHKKENHPKWISNRDLIKKRPIPEKNQWRDAVFAKDAYTCAHCGKVGGRLQAHHKAPYSIFKALRNEVFNGVSLCVPCHKAVHSAFSGIFGSIAKNKENRIAI